MSASFRRIDYSLRPAKHAERRMLNEIFRRLRPFQLVEKYHYVGLGSLWFSDFALFHRTLGIKKMQSIERDTSAKKRFEANKPFSSILVAYDTSSKVLPILDWNSPAFVWMDYDEPIDSGMVLDIQTITARASSGTVLAVTVQCHQACEIAQAREELDGPTAIVRFKNHLGANIVPQSASEDDLYGWPLGVLSRKIFADQIEATLATRNLGSTPEKLVRFHPICEIEYLDGAKMTTFVGIFFAAEDDWRLRDCGFDTLDFLPVPPAPIRIEIPILTMREIQDIERQLPTAAPLAYGAIPPSDADEFAKFYRYLPNFGLLEH
jgi:hypothetical protein